MSKMGAAVVAHDLSAAHAMAAVDFLFDIFSYSGLVEAGPAAARLILRVRQEEFGAAAGTGVHAFGLRFVVFAGKWPLGAFHPANRVLLGCEFLFPIVFGFHDLLFHSKNSCRSFRHSDSRTPATICG